MYEKLKFNQKIILRSFNGKFNWNNSRSLFDYNSDN